MNNKLFAAVVLAAFAVAPIAGITASEAGQAEINERWAFTFNPTPNEFGAWLDGDDDAYLYPYSSEIWFVRDADASTYTRNADVVSAIAKVYGDDDRAGHAPDLWSDSDDALDPVAIPSDSITFNPALILHTDRDYVSYGVDEVTTGQELDWIRACSQDSNLKKHLRTWYEPNHDFHGPRVDSGNYNPATVADVIQIESTYYLIDASSYLPNLACAGSSEFPFPTEGLATTIGDCADEYDPVTGSNVLGFNNMNQLYQPGLDTLRPVKLAMVEGSGTAGTIRLEYEWTVDFDDNDGTSTGDFDCLQFFDHMIHIDDTLIGASSSNLELRGDIWYIGNTRADSQEDVTLTSDLTFWDRDNNPFPDAVHNGANGETRTFYTKVLGFPRTTTSGSVDGVVLTVGKEFKQGDIFYVDGVRYEVPAIHVVDGNLASITLRTPLPKSEPCGRSATQGEITCDAADGELNWTSVPGNLVDDHNRVIIRDGSYQDEDFSVVTTQWIVEYNRSEPLPVDPPFNREQYRQVDDIDVQLWECDESDVTRDGTGDEDSCAYFPYGEITLDEDANGLPRWPEGERYLTMANPPQEWLDYWAAEATDFDDIRDRFPDDDIDPEISVLQDGIEFGINYDAWCDTASTCVDYDDTDFTYVVEWYEGRGSTNLLEIPEFEGQRSFDWYEISSSRDRFTSLLLPDRTNFASSYEACFEHFVGGLQIDQQDICDSASTEGDFQVLGGDYLHTTAWYRQDGETRYAYVIIGNETDEDSRGWHQFGDFDLYVVPGDAFIDTDANDDNTELTTDPYLLKLYGSDDRAEHAPDLWSDGEDAFNPASIPRDSVTFNPALILHTDRDYVSYGVDEDTTGQELDWIRACSQDSNLKKHLRTWYEPNHDFHGPRVDSGNYNPATVADVIQIESTYYLIDASSFLPNLACAGSSEFPFPTEGLHTSISDCANEYGDAGGNPLQFDNNGQDVLYQPGLDTMRPVKLAMVEGSGTAGTIRLEYEWTVDFDDNDGTSTGDFDCLQFFDHMIHIDDTLIGASSSNLELRGDIWYIGNTRADSQEDVTLTSDLTFWDRDNNPFPDPVHNGANGETRTFYTQVLGFPRTTDSGSVDGVVLKVGKEFKQGDIFYVDGVRYEVPAIHVVDGNLASITLRTPLPKSQPCDRELQTSYAPSTIGDGTDSDVTTCETDELGWTSVPGNLVDDHNRVIIRDGSYQDEDFSVVTTQWIVEYNATEPLPVDPPFNREQYRQVDDTDVQLWECDESDVTRDGTGDEDDCQFFPYGEITLDEDANGLPRWPEGERYLTMANPPQEWIDYWAAEATDFDDIRDRFPDDDIDPEISGLQDGIEAGINYDAWCDNAVTCIDYTQTNFTYWTEWYEPRLSTNLLEIPEFEGQRSFGSYEFTPAQDKFTAFQLPNRTNLASSYSYDGTSGAFNEFEDATGPGPLGGSNNVTLLGGDYLVMTSLRQPGTAAPPVTTTTSTSDTETVAPTATTSTTTTTQPTMTDTDTDTETGGDNQTPGFEIVALLAALGAAFVLVRRRL